MFSDKQLGLPSSLIAATKVLLEKTAQVSPEPPTTTETPPSSSIPTDKPKLKGGKTKVDLTPETNDKMYDTSATGTKPVKESIGRLSSLSKEEFEILETLTEEQIDEAIRRDDPVGKWLSDFIGAKDPKFASRSRKELMQLALGSYYSRQYPRYSAVGYNEEFQLIEVKATKPKTYSKSAIAAAMEKLSKTLDPNKVKTIKMARKSAKNARNYDTSHLPPGWKSSFGVKEENEEKDSDDTPFEGPYKKAEGDKPSRSHLKHLMKKARDNVAKKKEEKLKEEMELDEAIKLGSKVKMHSPGKDYHVQIGRVGEIDHGLHNKSVKKYTVDYGNKQSVMLDKSKVKLHKEELFSDKEMEHLKSVLGEARGRSPKNSAADDEAEEHQHIVMQLRKVVSTHGALPIKHENGQVTKISPQLATHALNKHAAMKSAAEKQKYEQSLHKSHESMKSALGQ